MKNGKIILVAYAFLFSLTTYFGIKLSGLILGIRIIDSADMVVAGFLPLNALLGVVISVAITAYFWKGKKGGYVKELDIIIDELKKVIWPTKQETKITTISVFVFLGIMMALLLALDTIWSKVSEILFYST